MVNEIIELVKSGDGKVDTNYTICKPKQDLRKYIERDVINQRLENVPAGKYKIMFITMWLTGLRISEVISIKRRDIDFKNSMLTIEWLKNRKYKERVIPLNQALRPVLELYTAGMLMDDLLFPMSRQYAHRICRKYMLCNPHMLRHSFAVNIIRQDGKITDLSRLLGHKHINTTMEYLKIVPSDLSKELQKIKFN